MTKLAALLRLLASVAAVTCISVALTWLSLAHLDASPSFQLAWKVTCGLGDTLWAGLLLRLLVAVLASLRGERRAGLVGVWGTQVAAALALLGATAPVGASAPRHAPSVVSAAAPHHVLRATATAVSTYTVRHGDCLWTIAEHLYGDPMRWRAIAAANLGRPVGRGAVLTDPSRIMAGWVLQLPSPVLEQRSSAQPSVHLQLISPTTHETKPSPPSSAAHRHRHLHLHLHQGHQSDRVEVILSASILGLLALGAAGARRTRALPVLVAEAAAAGAGQRVALDLAEHPDHAPIIRATSPDAAITVELAAPGSEHTFETSDPAMAAHLQLLVADALGHLISMTVSDQLVDIEHAVARGGQAVYLGRAHDLGDELASQVTCLVISAAPAGVHDHVAEVAAVVEDALDLAAPDRTVPFLRVLCAEPVLEHLAAPLEPKRMRRATEIAGYLLLAGSRPVSGERLRSAVLATGEGDGSPKTLANTLSALRVSLGGDESGPYLPPAGRAGRYWLRSAVTSDLADASAALERAASAAGAALVAEVRSVCDLIEAEPCSGVRTGWDWLLRSPQLAAFSTSLATCVERAVEACVAEGWNDLAAHLIERAAMVATCAEPLTRARLTLAATTNDVASLATSWHHELQTFDAIEAGLAPSSATEDHYWKLQRQISAAS